MNVSQQRRTARIKRKCRVRDKVRGTDTKPRLCVFRSNKHMYVQLISDESGRTLAAAATIKGEGRGVDSDKAKALGAEIAGRCKGLGIEAVVFDRNGYRYHGRVRALAEAAREAGLKF